VTVVGDAGLNSRKLTEIKLCIQNFWENSTNYDCHICESQELGNVSG
jgi:hypothetical protein